MYVVYWRHILYRFDIHNGMASLKIFTIVTKIFLKRYLKVGLTTREQSQCLWMQQTTKVYNAENLSLEETRTTSVRTSNPCRRVRTERHRRMVQDGHPADTTLNKKKSRKKTEHLISGTVRCLTYHIRSSSVTCLDWPRGFHEVKVPRFHDNGTGWW